MGAREQASSIPLPATSEGKKKPFHSSHWASLTEKGEDARKAKEGKRNLGAIIAMYDLLTKPAGDGIDALIVIDNEVLSKKI